MNNEGTDQVHGYIPSHILREFKRIVSLIHGHKHGAFSTELAIAINRYSADFKKTKSEAKHTHTNRAQYDKNHELEKLNIRFLDHLMDNGKDPITQEIPRGHVLTAIKSVEGIIDDRPAKARLQLLLDNEYCYPTNRKSTSTIKFKDPYAEPVTATALSKKSAPKPLSKEEQRKMDEIIGPYMTGDLQ